MDIVIDELVIEEDRPDHIARHNITIAEVMEVLSGEYVFIEGKMERWLIIGKTHAERFITVVIGSRRKKNTYGLVTARPARKEEKAIYRIYSLPNGGEYED